MLSAAANMIFVAAQVAWVGGTAVVLFVGIKYTLGLRINNSMEEVRSTLMRFVTIFDVLTRVRRGAFAVPIVDL